MYFKSRLKVVDGVVAQLIGQSVAGHRASDSECPTAVRAEPTSRNHQFNLLYKPWALSMGEDDFQPPQLRDCSTDFHET